MASFDCSTVEIGRKKQFVTIHAIWSRQCISEYTNNLPAIQLAAQENFQIQISFLTLHPQLNQTLYLKDGDQWTNVEISSHQTKITSNGSQVNIAVGPGMKKDLVLVGFNGNYEFLIVDPNYFH